jgi:Fe-S cluster assembly protein SufD
VTGPVRIDLADAATFPSRRVEDWRWTDVRAILRETPPRSAPLVDGSAGPFDAIAHRTVVFGNGKAGGASEATIVLADGEVLGLRFIGSGTGGHQSDVAVSVASGVSATILESYEGEGSYVSNVRFRIEIAEGAELTRIVMADEPATAVSLSTAEIDLGAGARLTQTLATSGARLQRFETRVRHGSLGGSVRLDGLYLLDGDQHADQTSEVEHLARDGATDQLCKGFVAGHGRGVFQGRIVVRKGADGTDARMSHHALIGSDRGEVDAKPELEIYADDVACAHGATVGALDPEQLFYMRARGMPDAQARAVLTEAFLGEVLDRVGPEPVREILRNWTAMRLEGAVHGL